MKIAIVQKMISEQKGYHKDYDKEVRQQPQYKNWKEGFLDLPPQSFLHIIMLMTPPKGSKSVIAIFQWPVQSLRDVPQHDAVDKNGIPNHESIDCRIWLSH